jgi:hypothetical protein
MPRGHGTCPLQSRGLLGRRNVGVSGLAQNHPNPLYYHFLYLNLERMKLLHVHPSDSSCSKLVTFLTTILCKESNFLVRNIQNFSIYSASTCTRYLV